ncbi:hypothetical protein AB0O42_17085 [Streptomyces sp. NPDC089922]|uniref:hypothetical protein n=1 Tax=unclassified Streptomyces TaxID=2593676 RepID=UPI003430FC00
MASAESRRPVSGLRGVRRWALGCAMASLVVTLPVVHGTTAVAAPHGAVAAAHRADPDPGGPIGATADVGVSVYGTDIQAVPYAVATRVTFTGAVYDTDGMFNPADSTLTVQTAGRYLIQGRVLWGFGGTSTDAFRSVRINVNGGVYAEDDQPIDGLAASQTVSTILQLDEGDTINLSVFQTGQLGAQIDPAFDPGSGQRLAPQLQAELLS